MLSLKKIFSFENNKYDKIIRILGIRFKFVDFGFTKKSKQIQNNYDLTNIKNAKKLIVFFIPPIKDVNGGIMSIFSICKSSREICKDAECIICTYPDKITYATNDLFKNNEKIYRWDQIIKNAKNINNLIIHVPEYMSKNLYQTLSKKSLNFLNKIENIQINILNQNIELMPNKEEFQDLYKITNNITQTIAHDRYATQEVCNKYGIPTHFLSVNIDISEYKPKNFEEKEKIIVLSPDNASYKTRVVERLRRELPDFKLITVQNMTFDEYMDLITKAYFTITFGEGFDGYFNQPFYIGSLGFSIYNEKFFPDKSWLQLKNVYESPADMEKNIVNHIKELSINKEHYYCLIKEIKEKLSSLYGEHIFKANLDKFYKSDYTYRKVVV